MIKPKAELIVYHVQNKSDRRWWALAVLAVADFVILDASVVNIALLAFERGLQSWEVVPEIPEDSEADERKRDIRGRVWRFGGRTTPTRP